MDTDKNALFRYCFMIKTFVSSLNVLILLSITNTFLTFSFRFDSESVGYRKLLYRRLCPIFASICLASKRNEVKLLFLCIDTRIIASYFIFVVK